MKYRIKQETKPNLSTYGKYKAVAVHQQTIENRQLIREVSRRNGINEGAIVAVMIGMSEVINEHLRNGDKVRLQDWGMMKLEIESEKVDSPELFKPRKHIRGVRLHFLPESSNGSPELYQDISFEREKTP